MARLRRHIFRPATRCAHDLNVAKALIGPVHKGDGLPVARPCGICFHRGIGCGQALCRPACRRLDPQLTHGFKQNGPAIGRGNNAARHMRLELGRRNFNRRAWRVNDIACVGNAERDFARCTARPIDLAHLAARPEVNGLAVG